METLRKSPYTHLTDVFIERVTIRSKVWWRHVRCEDGSARPVGPQYRTKSDLMGDHYDYLRRAGWLSHPPVLEYVAFSRNEAINDPSGDFAGFWSNEDGWVALNSATVFSQSEVEKGGLSLPMSEGNDATWVLATEAPTH